MEARVYDSFSESKEGSAHSGIRSLSPVQDVKGGLSQLLLEAANTLQGNGKQGGPAVAGSPRDTSPQGYPEKEGTGQLPASLGRQASQALAAWHRFFGHQQTHVESSSHRHENPSKQAADSRPAGHSNHRHLIQQTASEASANPRNPGLEDRPPPTHVAKRRSGEQNQSTGRANEEACPSKHSQHTASMRTDSSHRSSNSHEPVSRSTAVEVPHRQLQELPAAMSPTARVSSSLRSHSMNGEGSTDEGFAPRQVYYEALHTSGQRPSSRFGHASAVCGDRLFVFGGASSIWHSEGYFFHPGRQVWCRIPAAGKNCPPATFGAAACAAKGTIFLFGGKQDHKHCRRLYTLNPSTLQWKAQKESAGAPPACSSHTLTSVGQHGIYTFGGEGRRLSNWVYALDPDTCKWCQVNTLGTPPPARQGHTATWDGADSLIIIGGNSADKIFGDVRLLSLSTGYWSEARCSGNTPPARHSHSATMLDSNLLLVWGGCGEKGAVFNDAYILNTTTYRWTKLESIGSPPTGRYSHCCGVIGKQVLLFGGTSGVQFFDSLIRVSVDMGSQLKSLAESLANLSNHSNKQGHDSQDFMRVQLGNHLRQRHAHDMSQVAVTRAEISHRLFEEERKRSEALAAEVGQLKILVHDLEGRLEQQKDAHACVLRDFKQERTAEKGRSDELHNKLQEALERIQAHDSGAAVVDSYKTMFKQILAERNLLAERNVELEHLNAIYRSQHSSVELRKDIVSSSPPKAADPWESEHDYRATLQALDQSM